MASPVYLRDSALSISSDSFVEQSGNFKVLFRPPRLSRVRTALAGPSPLPRARPYPQPLRRKTGTARLGPRGEGPSACSHLLPASPSAPRPICSLQRFGKGVHQSPSRMGKQAQGRQVTEAKTRRTAGPRLPGPSSQLPGPAPRRRRHKKGPKSLAGRAGAAQPNLAHLSAHRRRGASRSRGCGGPLRIRNS